jgi:hypothetical protein
MRTLVGVLSLVLAGSVFPQAVSRNFGSVVFPGGTAGTSKSITRGFGSVVFPGGTAIPYAGNSNFRRTPAIGRGARSTPSFVYAFPVYVGGYDNSPQEPPPQQTPPQQPVVPVMIQVEPDSEYTAAPQHQTSTVYQPEQRPETAEQPVPAADPPRYLLAFKDHSIYSAVAYWVDGDTLHYFTSGNVHNQASISLIDRELTERLNRELGTDFTLPPAK